MIWGKKDSEKEIKKYHTWEWRPVYLWFPEKLIDGRWAWLHDVYWRWDCDHVDFYDHLLYIECRSKQYTHIANTSDYRYKRGEKGSFP